MKKIPLLPASILFALTGCKKNNITPQSKENATGTTSKGYIILSCDNSKVEYGMPDQYRVFSISRTSEKAYFTYNAGYILQTYIWRSGHLQNVTTSVYDSNNKSIYKNASTLALTSFWNLSTSSSNCNLVRIKKEVTVIVTPFL